MRHSPVENYPPTQKATVFETVGECVEGILRSSYERSRVCFGGFRPTKHVEEPQTSARGGSTIWFKRIQMSFHLGGPDPRSRLPSMRPLHALDPIGSGHEGPGPDRGPGRQRERTLLFNW